jgi:hypothetical protein
LAAHPTRLIPAVVHPIYKDQIQAYFDHYNIQVTWKVVNGGEINKTMDVSVVFEFPAFETPNLVNLLPLPTRGSYFVAAGISYQITPNLAFQHANML